MKKKINIFLVLGFSVFLIFGMAFFQQRNTARKQDEDLLNILYNKEYSEFRYQWDKQEQKDKDRLLPEAVDLILVLFQDEIEKEDLEELKRLRNTKSFLLEKSSITTWQENLAQLVDNYYDFVEINVNSECFREHNGIISKASELLADALANDLVNYYYTGQEFYWDLYVTKLEYVYDTYMLQPSEYCNMPYEVNYKYPDLEVNLLYIQAYFENTDFTGQELMERIENSMELTREMKNDLIESSKVIERIHEDVIKTLEIMDENKEYIDGVARKYE